MSNPNCKTHHWNEPSLWEHGLNRCSSVLHFFAGPWRVSPRFQETVQPSVFRKASAWLGSVGSGSAHVITFCCGILCARWLGALCWPWGPETEEAVPTKLSFQWRRWLWGHAAQEPKRPWLAPVLRQDLSQVAQTSNLLLILVILLAGYSVTLPFFQGRTVTKPGFIILRYKEVGQFLWTNLSMLVLKVQLLTLAKVFLMAGLMTPNGTELQKESTLQELVHPFCSTGFCWNALLKLFLVVCGFEFEKPMWALFLMLPSVFMEISFLNHSFQERYTCPGLFLSVHRCCWPAWSVTRGIAFTPNSKFFVQLCWLCSDRVQDVMFHQFTLHTLQDENRFWKRVFIFFAEFVHAFPRAWRALILAEAGVSAGVSL